jgi:hypothetical protein
MYGRHDYKLEMSSPPAQDNTWSQAASLTAGLGYCKITTERKKIMKIKEIKKGDKILHSHLGTQPPVSGIVMESPIVGRGVRSTILVDVKGSEVGLFDEMGSIYTNEILKVFRDDNWLPVEHA